MATPLKRKVYNPSFVQMGMVKQSDKGYIERERQDLKELESRYKKLKSNWFLMQKQRDESKFLEKYIVEKEKLINKLELLK